MTAPTCPRASAVHHRLIGWITVLGSALCFYLSTAVISWGRGQVALSAAYYVFARFLLGFLIVGASMLLQRQKPQYNHLHYIIGRTITNAIAVYCFYKAVELTTVASANILNMTYPLFVALFSWFMIRAQRDRFAVGVVIIASLGIWLILDPGNLGTGQGEIWGLLSGLTAGISIIYLNLSRQFHDSQTILLSMFGPGALMMALLFWNGLFWPSGQEWLYLLACSAAGVLGQYLLTYGFLYVTAVEGAVISSSRILIAALLGPLLVADPALTFKGWLGALIIFAADIALAVRKKSTKL